MKRGQYPSGKSGTLTFIAPNQSGQYEFRYFLNDESQKVTTSNEITVFSPNEKPIQTPSPTETPNIKGEIQIKDPKRRRMGIS